MKIKHIALAIVLTVTYNIYTQEVSDALISAMYNADISTVKKLIETQKDSVMGTIWGNSLVINAAGRYADIKRWPYPTLKYDKDIVSQDIPTLLENAKKILIFLLDHGAPINSKATFGVGTGETALSAAVRRNMPEIVEILLKHGADPSIKNTGGLTPYEVAVEEDKKEIKDIFGQHKMQSGLSQVRTREKDTKNIFWSSK